MKFLYFQDAHFKGINSRNRKGNYFEDLLLKFDELISIAKDNKCNAILDGGDLFESDKPAYSVLDELADRIEKAEIPIYSLFGNHSMRFAHVENSNNTGLMHLRKRSKYFRYLNEIQNHTFIIQGIDYTFGIEDELKSKEIILASTKKEGDKTNEFKILILHALVTPDKFFDNVSYLTPDQIKTNADLILLAHYHHSFKKEIGNKTFLNIGCFGRDNINEAKVTPSVLLIDTDKKSYEIIKLKSAKKADEIFDLSRYEELKANKKDIKEFIDSLRDIDLQSMDLGQQVVKIGKEQKIEQSVIDYILTKLEVVKNDK